MLFLPSRECANIGQTVGLPTVDHSRRAFVVTLTLTAFAGCSREPDSLQGVTGIQEAPVALPMPKPWATQPGRNTYLQENFLCLHGNAPIEEADIVYFAESVHTDTEAIAAQYDMVSDVIRDGDCLLIEPLFDPRKDSLQDMWFSDFIGADISLKSWDDPAAKIEAMLLTERQLTLGLQIGKETDQAERERLQNDLISLEAKKQAQHVKRDQRLIQTFTEDPGIRKIYTGGELHAQNSNVIRALQQHKYIVLSAKTSSKSEEEIQRDVLLKFRRDMAILREKGYINAQK